LYKPKLEFPNEALDAGVEGSVFLKILVGKDGMPKQTAIAKREPDVAFLFDEVARKFGMKCKFSPALDKNNAPISVWVLIPLKFVIPDFEPPACTRLSEYEMPEDAMEMGLEGWVGVAVLIDEFSMPKKTVIVAREPPYPSVFDDAARDVARNSSYKPATNRSGATKGWIFLKIDFKLNKN
jgi:TonB family protein